ncbi:PC-esterase domain-containing protein 1A-like [Gigantopelta aegis]|uniref:PC-esterase domain-containing protein 1A-like n=1 Tax=Gigantopelta aegis TaxID=1735272 RepID=UPI001B88959B|nr:PC-esterase domain-containing protein 1A-like [Gigantopelta aegis]
MAHIFLCKDVKKLLKNKLVVILGSSVQRAIYKDLVLLLQKNKYLTDKQLRMKGEMHFEGDELIAGGVKARLNNGVNFREVREYKTDHHWIKYYFITRCYNTYIETILEELAKEPQPDVLLVNSSLWDVTRYGYGANSVVQLRKNITKLCTRLKEILPASCMVLWNSAMPVSKDAKGGVLVPGADFLKSTISVEVLEANFLTCSQVVEFGFDVIDIHFHLQNQIHRRAEDGVHWDMTAHRRISNLILTHLSEAWAVPLPCNIKKLFDQAKLTSTNKMSTTKPVVIETSTKVQETPKISPAPNQTSMEGGSGKQKKKRGKKRNNAGTSAAVARNMFQNRQMHAKFHPAVGNKQYEAVCSQVNSMVQRSKFLLRDVNHSHEYDISPHAHHSGGRDRARHLCMEYGEPLHDPNYTSFEDNWQPYQERDPVHYHAAQRAHPRFTPYKPFY